MLARAPASSANLGPGFDTLALALDCYVSVEVSPAGSLSVRTSGCGSELPTDATHLAARVASEVAGTDRLAVVVHSEIPVGRGLGSSAAMVVAAAAAAGAPDPFVWAARYDGHPDNAAASALGGLVAAAEVDGCPVARRLPLDPDLRAVVLVPDRKLPTAEARGALPATVAHADAAFNLGRMGLLIAGLADLEHLVASAGDDRIHQDARASLFPEASGLLARLREAGAATSFWSGAGPSLVGICAARVAEELGEMGAEALERAGVPGQVRVLAPDLAGVVVTP
ncbi:MAG: homoserine kinase [Actinomycetota bacterium]|nr:homoserine kinase [Actinomycetota bacterium]